VALAATSDPNSTSTPVRAPRGTGPGRAAMTSSTSSATSSATGTTIGGPTRFRAGISACSSTTATTQSSGQV
jgi:hypothetical protein